MVVFEDLFNYADQTALVSAGWTVTEPVGSDDVQVAGDGTVQVQHVNVRISKQMSRLIASVPHNIYGVITAKTTTINTQFRCRVGTSVGGSNFLDATTGAVPTGSEQLLATFTASVTNPWISLLAATGGLSMTFSSIRVERQ